MINKKGSPSIVPEDLCATEHTTPHMARAVGFTEASSLHITKTATGFTLIELMVTVAIISILALIALPAYREYTVKAQVTEVFTRMNSVQADVVKEYSRTGTCPSDTTTVNGKYLRNITVASGTGTEVCIIQANFQPNISPEISNKNLGIALVDSASGTLSWRCPASGVANTVDSKYLPLSCQDS